MIERRPRTFFASYKSTATASQGQHTHLLSPNILSCLYLVETPHDLLTFPFIYESVIGQWSLLSNAVMRESSVIYSQRLIVLQRFEGLGAGLFLHGEEVRL